MTLNDLKAILVQLTENTYHYTAPKNKTVPYLVWAEDSKTDFIADNLHAETGFEGTIDLFTRSEGDALINSVETALNSNPLAWYLNSVQFEEDTGLIHYEWVFKLHG